MGEMRNAYTILVREPGRKRPHGSLDMYGRILLKWILEK
jgi:hypothetical protein